MKFSRKFKAVWKNGVERIFYAYGYAQCCNIKQYIKDWAREKHFSEPSFITLVEGYDASLTRGRSL